MLFFFFSCSRARGRYFVRRFNFRERVLRPGWEEVRMRTPPPPGQGENYSGVVWEAYTGGGFYMNSLGNIWLRGSWFSGCLQYIIPSLIPFDFLPHSIPPPLSMFTHTFLLLFGVYIVTSWRFALASCQGSVEKPVDITYRSFLCKVLSRARVCCCLLACCYAMLCYAIGISI